MGHENYKAKENESLNSCQICKPGFNSMFFLCVCNPGIVYYDLHQDHGNEDVLLEKRMTRHVFTVEEILQFPDDYHTKGVLSLPYGDIVEPFEAWYSKTKKMSRIDYYNGKLNHDIVYKRLCGCLLLLVIWSREG